MTNRAQFKNSSHFTFTLFKGRMEVRAVSVHEMPHSLSNLLLKFVALLFFQSCTLFSQCSFLRLVLQKNISKLGFLCILKKEKIADAY